MSSKIYETERVDQAAAGQTCDDLRATLKGYLERSCAARKEAPKEIITALAAQLEAICTVFLPHFARADSLALKYQAYYRLGSKLVYLLSALAVMAVAAQSLFSFRPHELILVEIFCIIAILVIIKQGNRVGWHRRWLDYRMLAERFRFAVFMAMAGEKASAQPPSQALYVDEIKADWISVRFSEVWAQWEELHHTGPDDAATLEILKGFMSLAWLEDQRGYHLKNAARHRQKHQRYSLVGEALFFLTLVVAVLHYLSIGGHALGPYLTFLAISLPAAGSAASALRAHFEHNKLARRSEKLAAYFGELESRLAAVTTREGLLPVVREAEVLMLNENSEWYQMIGFHKLEKPA